ncbi:MAG: Chromate resistance protein ChrB [Actinomycetota bacterium]
MDWLLITYRLPSEPSRHRVAVWRQLRRVGAVPLQQATWALPARGDLVQAIAKVVGLVEAAEGEVFTFDARTRDETSGARLEELFTMQREEEWAEFLSECGKFDGELDKEIRIRKFTAAELDEEEQNLERLRRWFRDLRRRDVFVAASQADAEQRLKGCEERLEEFAARVYDQGGEQ